jgi:ParB/RepB/Spo0J family partition protein
MQQIQITHIPLANIEVSRTNPRKNFDQTALDELAASIFEKGVLQPIIVRAKGDKYEVVAGERRFRASVLVENTNAGRNTIPAIIRDLSDAEVMEIQIIENLQRKDVHPMEEAVGFLHLASIKGMDAKEIAARVGKSVTYVAQRMKFNELIEPIQKVFYEGRIKAKDALAIAAMSKDTQEAMYEKHIDGESGELEFNNWVMDKYRHKLNDAPFDTDDATIDPKAGACTPCQYNSAVGNLFPEEALNPICRNPRCFENKCELNFTIQLSAALADPTMVLVSGWWDADRSKEWQTLKKKGVEVISKNDYEMLRKPNCPDREDFDGDNDTQEEDEADYQKALAEYHDELREYNSELNNPEWIRALKIDESDKGQIVYIKLNKKGKAAAKASAGKTSDQVEGEAELKDEIERLKFREKRAKELDSSKIYDAIKPHFNPRNNASVLKGPLREFELRALALAIYEKIDYTHRDDFRKLFKIDGRKLDLSHVDSTMINQMIRFFYLQTIPPPVAGQGGYEDRLKMAYVIAEELFPSVTAGIKAKQIEAASKRAERVEVKIALLQKQIREMKKAAQDAKKSTSGAKKGKGVKALLTDAPES